MPKGHEGFCRLKSCCQEMNLNEKETEWVVSGAKGHSICCIPS